jgi:hypothetical protein
MSSTKLVGGSGIEDEALQRLALLRRDRCEFVPLAQDIRELCFALIEPAGPDSWSVEQMALPVQPDNGCASQNAHL